MFEIIIISSVLVHTFSMSSESDPEEKLQYDFAEIHSIDRNLLDEHENYEDPEDIIDVIQVPGDHISDDPGGFQNEWPTRKSNTTNLNGIVLVIKHFN